MLNINYNSNAHEFNTERGCLVAITYKKKSVDLLINLFKNQKTTGHKVCFLIGSGVSVSAGVPDANGLISIINKTYHGSSNKYDTYSESMQSIPKDIRKKLIDRILNNSRMNKSHLLLGSLIKNGFVSRVLTTNFDELIEESLRINNCEYKTYDLATLRLLDTTQLAETPIIHLHGVKNGFLLLNTTQETRNPKKFISDIFRDTDKNNIWVVIGYSGNDDLVFNELIKLKHEAGLFWVGFKDQEPNGRVLNKLLTKSEAYYIGGESSDTLFDKIADGLGIKRDDHLRQKTLINLNSIDSKLNSIGLNEAADIFGIDEDKIQCIAYKIYDSAKRNTYIHRIFVKKDDYNAINENIIKRDDVNIIRNILELKGISLSLRKSHQFRSTLLDGDADVMGGARNDPAFLHLQISYFESDEPSNEDLTIHPVELLITKYTTPLNIYGNVIDIRHKKNHKDSKAADDLYKNDKYAEELRSYVNKYYYPFSHFKLKYDSDAKDSYLLLPFSRKPDKLFRLSIVPEEMCNYNCEYCCQTQTKSTSEYKPKFILDYSIVLNAIVASGCKRVMMTGGEPLLLNEDVLISLVKTISANKHIEDFWICSNGSMLSSEKSNKLFDAGLKRIVVSIGAGCNDKYLKYTRQCNENIYDLDIILKNIKKAVGNGLSVKVDVPLCRTGTKNISDLMLIINKAKEIGVKELAYFGLHRTKHNAEFFNKLYVDPNLITLELSQDNYWELNERENGQKIFSDGDINIIIPADINLVTSNCKEMKCKDYCQGVYAAYLKYENDRIKFQSCHQGFNKNTFYVNDIGVDIFKNDFQDKINNIWKWAYEL
jgi:molybdenum cofactor biosynthesis enzyme MoaA